MNKKIKIFLIVAVVAILIGVSYILYEFKFKTYDVADDQVDEIIEEPYELELPDGSTIDQGDSDSDENGKSKASEDSTTAPDDTSTNGDAANAEVTKTEKAGKITISKNLGATSSNSQSSSDAGNPSDSSLGGISGKPQSDGGVSVASIKGKYRPTLESLENQAAGRLNSLVGRAKNEYAEKSKTGDVNYGYFYNKYMGAAKSMEAQTDGAFNSVMNALENELKVNGYDKSYAKSFRTDYEARKKNLRTELMNKALGR